jgi:hypothetical protein
MLPAIFFKGAFHTFKNEAPKRESSLGKGRRAPLPILSSTSPPPPPICQETSRRDTANKRSLELCASIVLIF